MNREQWIQQLKKIGLSGYEAQVYLAILGETNAPASRVVRKSGVPQSKVYGALESLIAKGFAEQVLGDVKMYRGIPPRRAFANYRRIVEEDLAKSKSDMSQLEMIAPGSPANDPASLGIRLVKSSQLAAALGDALDNATTEVVATIKPPLGLPLDLPSDVKLIDRGIAVRRVAEARMLRDPVQGPALIEHAEQTGALRFIDRLPLRFSVVDSTIALLELEETDNSLVGLVVPNSGLAETLRLMFNTIWSQARSLDELPAMLREHVKS